MADFDHNPRGGMTVDRDSLHASVEYKRQVAALEHMKESEMDERMTLEEVRNEMRNYGGKQTTCYNRWADAIDAHLAQPSQAVDVGAIRQVIAELNDYCEAGDGSSYGTLSTTTVRGYTGKLTRAIGNAQAEE